ncbi:SAM-dependent methyltransferase [Streptosporangium canum]|uniref:SAM-dependent methyltransferase n=1 Tax=Streptosporangium canum TaxID=324952 RepID=UPI0037987749
MNAVPWSVPDTSEPSAAGLYDYLLGGKNYRAADEAAAEWVVSLNPSLKDHMITVAQENRDFIGRAVRHIVQEGQVFQFLDVGLGQLGDMSVHRVAQAAAQEVGSKDVKVVYVGNNSDMSAAAKIELAGDENAIFVAGNPLAPKSILDHPKTARFLNFNEPIAYLFTTVMHFILDVDDPKGVIDRIMMQATAGSYLLISHVTSDELDPEVGERVRTLFREIRQPIEFRTARQIRSFFGDLEMMEPGLVDAGEWRSPRPAGERHPMRTLAGVGRKKMW